MTMRKIYAALVRMHPASFRRRFESEMLATFDDAALEHGEGSLVLDAAVSLLRQWLLRPENWIMDSQPGFQRAIALHRIAWRANLVYLVVFLAVTFSLPLAKPRGGAVGNGITLVLFVAIAWQRHKNGLSTIANEYEAVSILANPRRSELVRKREGLTTWLGSDGWRWVQGPTLILFCLLALGINALLSHRADASTFRLGISALGVMTVLTLWLSARKLNRLAAGALQREIDAIDQSQATSSQI